MLVPVFSIRSHDGWGIGEIPDLVPFARWAAGCGFRTVQILPMTQVCPGLTSPYSGASAFALEPAYLGMRALEDFHAAGGMEALPPEDRARLDRLHGEPLVRWDEVRALKHRATQRAFRHFLEHEWRTGSDRARKLRRFMDEMPWLADAALFFAVHERRQKAWRDWEEPLRDRKTGSLEAARRELGDAVLAEAWLQWQLDEQWRSVRQDVNALGVHLMGDLPFVVADDSADVWARRDEFWLDASLGVPPTTPEEEPQDWGLPVYDWAKMQASDWAWWRARANRSADLYDSYRVDHVVGVYRSFWKRGEETGFSPAEEPAQLAQGEAILRMLSERAELVAEDLGLVPAFVRSSLESLGIPGYRVLRWEKDDGVYRDPVTWPSSSAATTGTHDTNSAAEWFEGLSTEEREALAALPGLERLANQTTYTLEAKDRILELLYRSPSDLVLLPIQDALGIRGQINVPGTVTAENWSWRLPQDLRALEADQGTSDYLRRLAEDSGRA